MIGPLYDNVEKYVPLAKEPLYNKTNVELAQVIDTIANDMYGKYYAPGSAQLNATSKYMWFAYDAIMVVVQALNSYSNAYSENRNAKIAIDAVTLDDVRYSDRNLPEGQSASYSRLLGVFRTLKLFIGTTGPIRFNDKNDRESDIYVFQFDGYLPPDGSTNSIAVRGVVKLDSNVYAPLQPWVWYTKDGSQPVTYTVTMYRWRKWGFYTAAGIAFVVLGPLTVKFIILPFKRHRKIRAALVGRWHRPAEMIRKIRTLNDPGVHVMTRATHHCFEADAIDASLHSNHGAYRLALQVADRKKVRSGLHSHDLAAEEENETEKVIVIVNVARSLRGATNVTRQLTREIVKNSKVLFSELIAMQSMVGKRNVAQFFGCVFTPEIVGTCYEWQPNGTLQQLVRHAPFELDLELTLALISDVVKGVESIYSGDGLSPHGRISSKIIFLTTKFDCRVANYGLPGFRDGFAPNWKGEDLLWSSPEILQNTARAPTMGSVESDVWSIAVIMSELVNHATPYARMIAQRNGDIEFVLDEVAGGAVKPELSSLDRSTPALEKLVSRMCCFNPNERVTLASVSQTLKSLLKAENVQVEQFSEKVLSRVDDWTDRLEITAQRMMHGARSDRNRTTEALLENVPASIARQIAEKKTVVPAAYENISLLSIDLPGFALLSDVVSPANIVRILEDVLKIVRQLLAANPSINQLHQQLQSGPLLCGCGVPEPPVADNTLQISLFALSLIYTFCSQQFESLKLYIVPRCAVAAGDCVGGVLRDNNRFTYAVFGDIVDEVGGLLTMSLPGRLLCTEKFVEVIENYERFIFKRSDVIKLKGKDARTFWLEADVEPSNTNQPQFLRTNPKKLVREGVSALGSLV